VRGCYRTSRGDAWESRVNSRLVVVAIGAVALVACEQILGLDKYAEVDASPCDACDAGMDVIPDAPPADVLQVPDGATEASSWARWRMPNSAAEVLDGASEASLANATPFDGGIKDDVTGLFWYTATLTFTAASVDLAAAFCAQQPQGPWRLPTRIELASLLDTTRPGAPFVTPAFANDVMSTRYWTSSYARPLGSGLFWIVDFTTGDVQALAPGVGSVLCVR
jgi:hypothetical protein